MYKFVKNDKIFTIKEVINKTPEILNKIYLLRKSVWEKEKEKEKVLDINIENMCMFDKIDIKQTTRIFIVEDGSEKIVASATLCINNKPDEDYFYIVKDYINCKIPFPHYFFRRSVVDSDYQNMGIANELIKYRCRLIQKTDITTALTLSSAKNLNNFLKSGFIFLDSNPTRYVRPMIYFINTDYKDPITFYYTINNKKGQFYNKYI